MTYEQIHSLFKQGYNQANWKQFLGETFSQAHLLATPETLTGIDEHVARKALKHGYIALNENGFERQIAVYEVELQKGIILERNRVGLRNLLRKYWKNIDAAFIVYHNPENKKWRFTYVSELTGFDAEGNFQKIQTEPKRYTYMLGEGESTRTASERFAILAKKANLATLEDVKEAFSVEKLSKAFFDEYKKHYDLFCKYLLESHQARAFFPENNRDKHIRDFSKKLLGRIVFLYFIQKKGWMGVPVGSKWGQGDFNFLTNLFKQYPNPDLFYSEVLTRLFFDTLNTKRQDDITQLLKDQPCRIPYLNGGLFEEEDPKQRNIIISGELFQNLFEFFNQYNFTIYEDDPNDHTVAVDPEMLGHIFENLLEDNKDKGAFYTPKEIVHYMCQESLIEYLKNYPPQEECSKTEVVNSPEEVRSGRNSKNYFKLPYNPALKKLARQLRKAGNLSEVLFWNRVKNKQFKGYDFDRQKIVGNYIVDFFCTNCNVVIEIDGSSHNDKVEYDAERDKFLQSLGLTVIHIPVKDVMNNLDGVMQMLFDHPALTGTPPKEGNQTTSDETSPPLEEQEVVISPPLEEQEVVISPPLEEQEVVISPPLEEQEVVTSPPLEEQGVVISPPLEGQGVVISPPLEGQGVVNWAEKVQRLLKHKEAHALTQKELEHLNHLLDTVKICDPAIGSGAFPMGLLQEIFTAKQTLWHSEHGNLLDFPASDVKLNIIQNSIYGVDIEKGAVDIARLRFWLSLVVDEENPKPLPNLDYKIVVGNSLVSKLADDIIELDWSTDITKEGAFGQKYLEEKITILQKISQKQKQFFKPDSDKKNLAPQIRQLKIDLLINQLELLVATKGIENQPNSTGKKLVEQTQRYLQTLSWKKSIEQLKKLKNSPPQEGVGGDLNFFDWKLDFPEILNEWINPNPGFDIVIGNPPYIQLQKNSGKLAKEYEKQGFLTFERTGDIYSLFYEKGIQLLKPNGILTYITSNKWMRAGYGKSTRAFFCQHNPLKLIDLGSGVFESATVDTNILIIQKTTQKPTHYQLKALDLTKEKNITSFDAFADRWTTLTQLSDDAWTIANELEQRIKQKIEKKGKPLKNWDINIYRGVLTGYNEAFIIDGKKKDELIAQDPKSAEIIKPILRGRDIKRYKAEFADLWLIATFPALKLNIDDYPAVKAYLQSFGKRLHQTGEEFIDENGQKVKTRKKTGNKWFETQDQIAYYQEFEKEKIIYPNMATELQAFFDRKNFYCNQKCFIITGNALKYITALFNSKVVFWYFKRIGATLGSSGYEMSKIFIELLPIPKLSEEEQLPFVRLVEQILALKEQGKDTTALEAKIDLLVYKLYDLTYEEVKVIDPAFALSREAYENLALE